MAEVANSKDFAVSDVPDCAFLTSQLRDPQPDGLDHARGHLHVHVVAYSEWVLDQNEDAETRSFTMLWRPKATVTAMTVVPARIVVML